MELPLATIELCDMSSCKASGMVAGTAKATEVETSPLNVSAAVDSQKAQPTELAAGARVRVLGLQAFDHFKKFARKGKFFEMLSWGVLGGRSPPRNLCYPCLAPRISYAYEIRTLSLIHI